MNDTPLEQSQPILQPEAAPTPPATTEVIQPTSVGVSPPEGYTGPWPKPGMDLGNPSSWVA